MDQKCHFRLSFVWKFEGTIGNRDQSILSVAVVYDNSLTFLVGRWHKLAFQYQGFSILYKITG